VSSVYAARSCRLLRVSSHYYMCLHTTIHVSSCYYICALIYKHICPHTTICVSSYCYICVLILLCVSSNFCIHVLILLCMCPQCVRQGAAGSFCLMLAVSGTQFTGITSTKVQILTQQRLLLCHARRFSGTNSPSHPQRDASTHREDSGGTQFTRFASTKYTYSRANSLTCPQRDASTQRGGGSGGWGFRAAEALNLLALLVKKYKY
jgi:hypothetical protein